MDGRTSLWATKPSRLRRPVIRRSMKTYINIRKRAMGYSPAKYTKPSFHRSILLDLTRRDSCQFGKDRVENELLHPRPSVDEDLLDLVPYGLVEIGRCVSRLPSDLPSLISTGPRVGPEVARLIRQWGVRIDYQSLVFVSKS